jgi:hypothetical protein
VEGGWTGTGNIDNNPAFVDPDGPDNIDTTADDNFRLSPGSPCIDAGNNECVPAGLTGDLDENPRFIDDPDTDPDTGNGSPPIVDMGAYEYQVAPQLVDAYSCKTHGAAGDFNIELPLEPAPGEAGIESRSNGPTKVVLCFTEAIVGGQVSLSCGTLGNVTIIGNCMTIEMSNVSNQCCLCITITGIEDLQGYPLDGVNEVYIAVLRSDVNGDHVVNVADLGLVKSELFQPVTGDNFTCDINDDGIINAADLALVKFDLFTSLGTCPSE